MSRVVVIGATGHIGTYLVPRLVAGGHAGQPLALPDHGLASCTTCTPTPRRPSPGLPDLTVAGTTVKSHICGRPQGR